MDNSSGVGVLDKAVLVLNALEAGPASLAQLVQATGLARPTAHRLAVALEHHRIVSRDTQGRFVLGPRLSELSTAAGEDRLLRRRRAGARPSFGTSPARARNSTGGRVTSGCAWPPPSVPAACATPCRSARRCR